LAEANIWPIYRRFYDIALRWREAHHRGDTFETPKPGAMFEHEIVNAARAITR
jgi:hypothetical protein